MDKQTEEGGWRGFIRKCLKVKTEEEFNTFFHVFLTAGEREELAGRYWIIKELLKEEKTQREIAAHYGISIAKISRGSNALKTIEPNLKKFLEE